MQDNHSRSGHGIVRGMHFQIGEGAAKLVRCAAARSTTSSSTCARGSPTFGEWEGFELTEENMRVLYCPVGFAHGFCVLSDVADVIYKQSNYYSDEIERGIAYNDPEVGDRVAAAGRGADPLRTRRDGAAAGRDRRRAAVRVPGLRCRPKSKRPDPGSRS